MVGFPTGRGHPANTGRGLRARGRVRNDQVGHLAAGTEMFYVARHLDGHLCALRVSADAGPAKANTPARPTITGRNRSLARTTLLGSTNGTEAGAAESEQTH